MAPIRIEFNGEQNVYTLTRELAEGEVGASKIHVYVNPYPTANETWCSYEVDLPRDAGRPATCAHPDIISAFGYAVVCMLPEIE